MASAAFRSKAVVLLFIISLWGLCLLIVLLCITKMRGSRKVRQGVAEALDNVSSMYFTEGRTDLPREARVQFSQGVLVPEFLRKHIATCGFPWGGGGSGPCPLWIRP